MIPSDYIDVTTGWWVVPAPGTQGAPMNVDAVIVKWFDRPCVTCGGKGCVVEIVDKSWDLPFGEPVQGDCPADCIDGRHTFEIEVQTCDVYDCARCIGDGPGSHDRREPHRVSIVPGRVLPIVNASHATSTPRHIDRQPDGTFTHHTAAEITPVTLPPAAKPGMWAVNISLHETSNQ